MTELFDIFFEHNYTWLLWNIRNVSRSSVAGKAMIFFQIFDTDKNGLIDALEFASTTAALSGMKLKEIVEFVLSIYDFDGSQMLSIDEVTLAFKSLSTGLCKCTK